MLPYYSLFILAIYCAWFIKPKQGKWLLFFLMLFMSMFRGMNVGGDDTIAYYQNGFSHEFSLESSVSYDLEFLFVWWTNFIRKFGLNPRWCLYSLSIIQFLFLYLSSKRFMFSLEKMLFFFLLLNYYYLSLEISRQLAANFILLYGYSFLMEEGNKKYWFFPIVLLASSIHLSSILALPIFFCTFFKIDSLHGKEPIYYALLVVSFVFMQFQGAKMTDLLLSRLDIFSLYQHLGKETVTVNSSLTGYFVLLLKLLIHFYVYTKIVKSDNKLIANILLFSIVFSVFLSPVGGNIGRLKIIPGLIEIVAYSKYLKLQYIPDNTKYAFVALITLFWGVVCLWEIKAGNYFLNPYYMTL